MPVDTFRVIRLVQKQMKTLNDERISGKLAIDYENPKDGMLVLHGEWQDLLTAVRKHDVQGKAALAAIQLAAAAIKFASDLGDPPQMGIEQNEPRTEVKKKIRLYDTKPNVLQQPVLYKRPKGRGKAIIAED